MHAPGDADLRALPKVELHVHLGGAIEPETVAELARRHGVDLEAVLPNGYPDRYADFSAFLRSWFPVNDLVQTPDDVELVAAAFARRQAEHRVRYTETLVTAGTFLARLAREQVPLEVCPTSNVLVGLAPSLEEHPIVELWRAGVNVTVHSDDPAMFRTSITDELGHAVRLLELDVAGLAELERRAARAAFAPADVRERVLAEIDAWEAARA